MDLLIVEDEGAHAEAISRAFLGSAPSATLRVVPTLSRFHEAVASRDPDVVLMDLNLADGCAIDVLQSPSSPGNFPILILTAYGTEEKAAAAIKAGAFDYIVKSPESFASLPHTVEKALRRWELVQAKERAERAILESETRLRLALEAGRMGSWDLDMRTGRGNCSEGYFRLLGFRLGGLLPDRRTLRRRVHPEDRKSIGVAYRKARDQRTEYTCEFRVIWPDGTVHWVELRGRFVYDGEGRPERVYGVIIDIDEKKETERQLEISRDAAEQASRAKSEFLANMSHEIRTPLNGLFGMLQYLQTTELTPEQSDCIAIALNSGQGLLKVLNDILDLSRIEAGRFSLQKSKYDPARVVREVVGLFRAEAQAKNIVLRCEVAPEFPAEVVGDEIRLRQVLFNLVGNSLKFTHQGVIYVSAAARRRDADRGFFELFFSVKDSGIGIPNGKLREVLEPFTQVDGSSTRKYGGAGLGLGIVKRLVDRMNGTLAVESELGKGTRIDVSVEVSAPVPPVLPGRSAEGGIRPLKILVAEDEQTSLIVLERLLLSRGHQVCAVADGQEYVRTLEKGDYDLVFMDIQLPHMDGVEATRYTRQLADPVKARIPIVALTAHARSGDRERFLSAGMNDYISKPVGMDEITRVLKRFA